MDPQRFLRELRRRDVFRVAAGAAAASVAAVLTWPAARMQPATAQTSGRSAAAESADALEGLDAYIERALEDRRRSGQLRAPARVSGAFGDG